MRSYPSRRRSDKERSFKVGVFCVSFCAFIIVAFVLMGHLMNGEEPELGKIVDHNLGSGMGMGGGLAAVGSGGFDVSRTPSKKKDGAPLSGHTHEETVAMKNVDSSPRATQEGLPPADPKDFDRVTDIVQCATSRGNLTIDVRRQWSPLGADQFLKLVALGHFDDLPFTRVCPRYITQFGRKYRESGDADPLRGNIQVIKDDPSLWGKRDMDFGYLFFAGSGANSRYDEMVVALCPMKGCRATGLGHADWETPVGTIRKEGFDALNAIMASGKPYPRLEMHGQHPRAAGPDAGRLMREKDYLSKEYPYMEYWRGCTVTHRGVSYSRPLHIDHPNSVQLSASLRGSGATAKDVGANKSLLASPEQDKVVTVRMRVSTLLKGEGDIVIELHPLWAPVGVQKFIDLVRSGIYKQARFYRVIKGFMAQFGIPADPAAWKSSDELKSLKRSIPDEKADNPHRQSNTRGTVSFAHAGANTRAFSLFINFADNAYLDKQNFPPIGRVKEGLEFVDAINAEYGEGGTGDGSDGKGPSQGRIGKEGNAYLDKYFPRLSYIINVIEEK